jgi:TonB family protein
MRKYVLVTTVSIMLFALAAAIAQKNNSSTPQFKAPEIVSAAEAVYPVNAVNGGTVVLNVAVSERGEIQDVKVVRDVPGFTAPALAAIKQWKFRPATLDGKPVAAVIPVAFSFGFPAACAGH